jgi:hypothetical protein
MSDAGRMGFSQDTGYDIKEGIPVPPETWISCLTRTDMVKHPGTGM